MFVYSFTVGGGIRTVDDMRVILSEGADKVALTVKAAIEDQPSWKRPQGLEANV